MLSFKGSSLFFCLGLPLATLASTPLSNLPSTNKLETIVVYGQQTKLALEAEQALTPGGVTLVDAADLYQRNVSSMADMLRYVPGLWVASGSTGDSSYFSSRGSNLDATNYDGNGIKLLQDGLPVTAADGNNHNRDVDPLNASNAVVARGANALTYGASTLGGAIDIITPTARDRAPLDIYFTSGSDDQFQGRMSAGTVSDSFDALLTIEARRWDGYREHQQQERESLYANAGWQFNNSVRTRLYFTYIDNDQELPGNLSRDQWKANPEQANPDNVIGNFLLNVETWRVANKTEWDIDDASSLSVGISYEEQDLYHPIVYSQFFSLLIDTVQRNTGTAIRYNLRQGSHDLLLGLNYGISDVTGGNYSHEGGRRENLTTRVDNSADSLELFLVDRWQFAPNWTAVYGAQAVSARREVRNIAVSSNIVRNPEADYDSINPRLGLIYQLTANVELFSNISKLYEAPTNFELEDDERGNEETLNAMQGGVFEIGTRGSQQLGTASEWHWDIALYYAQLKDEILSKDDPNAAGTSLSTNVDDTIHSGLEVLLGANFVLNDGSSIQPLLNLTVNEFSFDDDAVYGNNDLPAAPDYAMKGEILYRNTNGFFAGPTFDIIGKRYADFQNTYTVDSYKLLGLRAGLTGEDWEVWGEVRNITDENYVSLFSVKDVAAPDAAILSPGEPRAIYVGVRLQL
ncbi:TonB-dependent receptor family protein [Zhongshania sp. BJYM1]|uniref:TonB-dependent receptor family protein n=1 Tax=Zhongshania aquatica TaxID=2965069 RepID=UPI0022B5047A|nr:TonB-dependent receptor [Marortus sp. BJYM1]